jgi:hypothetical protein
MEMNDVLIREWDEYPEDYYDDGDNDLYLGDPDWDYPRD